MTVSSGQNESGFAPRSTLIPGWIPDLQDLHQRRSVSGLLADRLVVQDHAADVLGNARRAEQELAVRAAVVLRVVDADRIETFLDGAGALVRSEDAFPRSDQRASDIGELSHGVRLAANRLGLPWTATPMAPRCASKRIRAGGLALRRRTPSRTWDGGSASALRRAARPIRPRPLFSFGARTRRAGRARARWHRRLRTARPSRRAQCSGATARVPSPPRGAR